MKIIEIQLLTKNIAATESFYRHALAVVPDVKTETQLVFLFGHSKLIFTKTYAAHPQYHFAFNIPCNQIQQAKGWMQQKVELLPISPGVVLTDFSSWNAKSFYFYDNNGNILEFIARFDLLNATDTLFNEHSILSISEIGIATDDVLAFTRSLAQTHGIAYFRNFEPTQEFTAMGDDNALLIVVNTHRKWYPTAIPAIANPAKVILDHLGQLLVLEFAA